jgi:hypothetical protein
VAPGLAGHLCHRGWARRGHAGGGSLTLSLLPDQAGEGTYALGLRVERGDSTLPGTIRAVATNGTTLCVVEQGSALTLHRGEVAAFP